MGAATAQVARQIGFREVLSANGDVAALAEGMYSGSVGRRAPLFTESDLSELLRPLS